MKYLLLPSIVFLLLTSFSANSQSKLSLGPEIALPNKEVYNFVLMGIDNGFGGSLRFEGGKKQLKKMVTVGYLSFGEGTYTDPWSTTTSTFKVIPVQGGLKYYFFDSQAKSSPFLSFELGLMHTSTKRNYNNNNPMYEDVNIDLSTAPGIGFQLGGLELGFRLQYNLSDAGFTAYYYNLRAGYNLLPLGKRTKKVNDGAIK